MLQNARKFGSDGIEPLQRNAQFPVVEGSSPRRRLGHVKKVLVVVKNHLDAGSRFSTKFAGQLPEFRFQGREDLTAKGFGTFAAFVAQYKVSGFSLGVAALRGSFPLSTRQLVLNRSVWAQHQRMLPALDCISGAVCRVLRVAQNSECVG